MTLPLPSAERLRRTSRRRPFHRAVLCLGVVALLFGAIRVRAENAALPSRALWYARPAAKWEEALPVGNGRLGAMVFGGLGDERIQFNEDTLWTGRPHDYVRGTAREQLDDIRQFLFEEDAKGAAELARRTFLSDPVRQKAYQPFGDLRLHFPGNETATDYRRELDLDTAVARVSYRVGEVAYRREIFASYPAQAVVVRLTADRPRSVSFTVAIDSPHKGATTTAAGNANRPGEPRPGGDASPYLRLRGQVGADGLQFESRVAVVNSGGRVMTGADRITVENADAVTLVLVAATSFKNFQDITADPAERCVAALAKIGGENFDALRAAHVADYQRLFRRVSLDLGGADATDALPTNERLWRVKSAGLASDPGLVAQFFAYGRYLLIASSRPGSQPANLQGVWNELLDPPWESKWTTNINLEMNYWPAELTALGECHEPLFDLIDDLVVSGGRTARRQYGAGGWVVHHNTDLWRGTAPINNIDGIWPTGGAWLCHHLWEHFLFTGDREFLARRAYPAMKGAAQFFVDFLVDDRRHGWLVTVPSYSPEQGTLTIGPTMDNQLIRALLEHTIAAAKLLGVDADFAAKLTQVAAKLPPNQIGQHGQLQEWLDDIDRPNNAHRHMSPLWALYPGDDITPADAKIFAAAKTLLKWRGDGSTGWSYAWRIPLWARVGDGEFAFRQLDQQLQRKTLPNLFDLCGPFQIDGNFGATAGIVELLMQSHERAAGANADPLEREIALLPALPRAWPAGRVSGLRARGGFAVDLAWAEGRLTRVVVRSALGEPLHLRVGDRRVTVRTQPGGEYAFDAQLRLNP